MVDDKKRDGRANSISNGWGEGPGSEEGTMRELNYNARGTGSSFIHVLFAGQSLISARTTPPSPPHHRVRGRDRAILDTHAGNQHVNSDETPVMHTPIPKASNNVSYVLCRWRWWGAVLVGWKQPWAQTTGGVKSPKKEIKAVSGVWYVY